MLRLTDLRAGLLRSDACIIDESDRDVVVAVRVPKAAIQQNLRFLAAMADAAGDLSAVPCQRQSAAGDTGSRSWAWMNRAKRVPWKVLVGLPILLGLSIAILPSSLIALVARPSPPIELRGLRALSPTILRGDSLVLVATTRRNRACLTEVDRLFIRRNDGVAIHRARQIGGAAPITGDFVEYRVEIPTPRNIAPGHYIYRGITHSNCADGGAYDQVHPEVEFEVIPDHAT